jgi:hypothetical protein
MAYGWATGEGPHALAYVIIFRFLFCESYRPLTCVFVVF